MIVAGVDEAGRGALAGPIVACCVVFKSKFKHKETLNDSKKLSETKRETIFRTIKNDIYLGIGLTSNKTIDQINVLNATMLAMKKAINKMNIKINYIIIDGNRTPKTNIPCEAKIKADQTIPEVQAASICAKVIRDKLMRKYNKKYTNYEFNINKGYGTKNHYDQLHKKGHCPIHRQTFNLNKQLTLF